MKLTKLLTSLSAFTLLASSASANLLVYEGFDYGTAGADRSTSDVLHGQPDGSGGDTDATGLSGTWQDSKDAADGTGLFMSSGSLTFGGLPTSGNSVRSDTNSNADIFTRGVTSDLDSGSSLWFTFLADKLQNNFNAAEGGVVISSGVHGDSQVGKQGGVAGYHGFSIAATDSGNAWTIFGWDGTNQVSGTSSVGVTVGGGDVSLLGGEIQFNAGGAGEDVFNLYDYSSATAGDRTLIDSILVDADETLLSDLNVTRRVNTAYDEIRFATTEEEALGVVVPEASAFGLIGLAGLALLRRRRS